MPCRARDVCSVPQPLLKSGLSIPWKTLVQAFPDRLADIKQHVLDGKLEERYLVQEKVKKKNGKVFEACYSNGIA